MVKNKSSSGKGKEGNTYLSILKQMNKDIQTEEAEERLRQKGIRVGEKGYNVEKAKKEYQKEKLKEKLKNLPNKFVKSFKLSKPKASVKSVSPEKVLRTFGGDRLVREGRTGYFNDEYEENISWLS
jgi:hypothetical protein